MLAKIRFLCVAILAFSAGCNQIIGLSDYEKTDNVGADGDSDADGDGDSDGDSDSDTIGDTETIAECAIGCSDAIRGDGTCDEVCKNLSCGFDDGDCDEKYCVDGCIINDIGDGVCNGPCNTAECDFDKGDCGSVSGCPPGCDANMIGDSICQYQCLSTTCGNDGGDCDDALECSAACGNTMLGDGFCDSDCNNPECFFDNGDCGGTMQGCDPGATSCLDDCVPCARTSTCLDAVNICNNNALCTGLITCMDDCANRVTEVMKLQCIDDCYASHPDGVYDYTEMRLCLYCHACPVSCDAEFGSFCSENGY
ncbi:MAG: hypothetical protein JXX29_21005 [Deltaproteobacteria bacterium]|nr:hypothetical protein [Deltaproteobacteria bacterium]MBN2674174.1 hypothetical protein [Deltaproteobacteria bacterium]